MQPFLSADSKVIAVDFDGTIVEHKYPAIGKEMLFAFATLKALQQKGHKLILWTFRAGNTLQDAVEYCRKNGIEFYAVNKNYPEEIYDENISRKINADIFIDDRNVGGFLGWSDVWQTLHPEGEKFHHQLRNSEAHHNYNKSEGSIFKKLFGKK
ncbi:MAG: hydrolase [Bacteroidetes bacterium]|nr:hydrolase [Bacteroidota bacterium]